MKIIFTHCLDLDLDLNGKRPGVTSDGNFSSYLIEADTTISSHFLWAQMEGCTNRARPSQPSLKNCQNGTF